MENSPPRADNISRWLGVALALGYFVMCVLWTQRAPLSWNDIARVAAIESLAERGTWSIDGSPWLEQTQDKVFLNGRFYSDKMPLLSWVAAGGYALERTLFGASLAPDCAERRVFCGYYGLTLVLIGVPASLLIWLMYDWARTRGVSLAVALLGTIALGLGTMILPYSLVLNHHLPAAVSLFAAFYLLTTRAATDERWLFGAGFFTALAIAFDPLAGILALALSLLAVLQFKRRVLYFVLGGLLPLIATAWLDWQMVGTIIPPYLIPNGYAFEGSAFPPTVGGNGTPDDPAQYAFKMFLGAQGLFAYNPILIFALVGVVVVVLTAAHALRLQAIVIGGAVLLLAMYLATRTGNLGGTAYGERWYVQAIPLMMAFLFFAPPLARFRARPYVRWVTAPLFVLALLVSMFSTYQGAQNPWAYVPPPAHPTRDAASGNLGWRWEVRLPLR